MKKFHTLRKKLAIEGGIAAVTVLAFVGFMLFASGLAEEAERDRRQAQVKTQTLKRDVQKATERLESSGTSIELYESLKENRDEMSMVVERKNMTRTLGILKNKYRLTRLNMQIEPEQAFENEAIKEAKLDVVRSKVTLEFGGMSDRHVYSFISDMQRKLPGFIKIEELTVQREKDFDIEVLRRISNGDSPQMVSGEIQFEWYGYPDEEAAIAPLVRR